MLTQPGTFRECANREQLAFELSLEVAREVWSAVTARGECHMVVPGGRSPQLFFERLRGSDLPWRSLHLYPSDERCVPTDNHQRNDRMLDEILLPGTGLPPEHLHRIPAELGPEEGARRYAQFLQGIPAFDIVLLGVGADGHVASLFPRHPALRDCRDAVPVAAAPKPPPLRVSIGLRRLQEAGSRHVIALGADKRAAVCDDDQSASLPVRQLAASIWCALL
jgi:6-phosphogluconolactonase